MITLEMETIWKKAAVTFGRSPTSAITSVKLIHSENNTVRFGRLAICTVTFEMGSIWRKTRLRSGNHYHGNDNGRFNRAKPYFFL